MIKDLPKKRINGKKKGNAYECKIANEMSEMYGHKIYSNRYCNRLADDKKVDISTPDLNIQAKCTATNINFSKIIMEMENAAYDPSKINVIFNKQNNKGEFAILRKSDLLKLLMENTFNIADNEDTEEEEV